MGQERVPPSHCWSSSSYLENNSLIAFSAVSTVLDLPLDAANVQVRYFYEG